MLGVKAMSILKAAGVVLFVVLAVALPYQFYLEGKASVRRSAYVQFYPSGTDVPDGSTGACLSRPEGAYCPRDRGG